MLRKCNFYLSSVGTYLPETAPFLFVSLEKDNAKNGMYHNLVLFITVPSSTVGTVPNGCRYVPTVPYPIAPCDTDQYRTVGTSICFMGVR